MKQRIGLVTATILLGAGPALAQPAGEPTAPPATPPGDTTPPATPPDTTTTPPPTTPPVVTAPPPPVQTPTLHPSAMDQPNVKKPTSGAVSSKLDITFYGFVELDTIYDSTQGLNDLAGNTAIARPHTYAGDHGQTIFGARNSRLGMKLGAPDMIDGVKVTGQMEMDFLGNQPPGLTEPGFWTSPTFRLRHMNLKLETKVIDLLFGQYWNLFGWQGMNQVNTVQIQGIPAEIYSRSPQIRLSKKAPLGDAVSLEFAVAASRPAQRASATPDGQAGFRINFDSWKAWHTSGSTGSALDSAMIGASVVGRRFAVNEYGAVSHSQVVRNGYGLSLDALLPVIPASKENHGNALTIQGSYVTGAGIADLFQSLSGGVSNPALPNPTMANPAPTYTPNVDNGLVMWFKDKTGTLTLHPIQWTSYIAGFQYYLPPSGHVWIAGNYSHMESQNAHLYGGATKVWDNENWYDGNLFVDVTANVRFGAEFSRTEQTYVDGTKAVDNRGQFSAFLLF